MFKHILCESELTDTVSVHRKYRTSPPRHWFCRRELYEAEPDFDFSEPIT